MRDSRWKATRSILALAVAATGAWGFYKAKTLSDDQDGEKPCPSLLPADTGAPAIPGIAAAGAAPELAWSQRGGTINDASCLSRVPVHGVVEVRAPNDVAQALAYARTKGLKVTPAGVKHSMGGHAFQRGGLVLDMRRFNAMKLNAETRTLTVESGASWHDIQDFLHPRFAVRAMQSTDIFTVGGSISVNAHGMDHQAGAMARSIKAMRVMLADGSIQEIGPDKDRALFDLVVGGYGLFGVILDVDLDIADNLVYRTSRRMVDYRDFPRLFAQEIEPDRDIGLMYAHLSTAPSSFLQETLVYLYRRDPDPAAKIGALGPVGSTRIRRLTVNLAKKNDFFKEAKWFLEKHLEPRFEACTVSRSQAQASGEACLVSRNDPMHNSVAYLRNNLKDETDILHEYFVPRDRLVPFIDGMRKVLLDHRANVLNASVRVVHDEANFLSYSPKQSFSVVLYLNQAIDAEGNRRMQALTRALIDLTLAEGGRFFLPYQLHYDAEQLRRSYPEIAAFFAAKRQHDPQELLTNSFYSAYAGKIAAR